MIKTTTIIIGIIIIAALGFFFIPTGQNNEVPASFGSWKLELVGIDSEGNEIPFDLQTNNAASLLSFTYEGRQIDYINYRLKAKATGTGFTRCEIDISDVTSDGIIFEGAGGPGSYSYIFDDKYGSSSAKIELDNTYHMLFYRGFPLDRADDAPSGDYTGEFRFHGTARYRGIGDTNGVWETEEIDFKAYLDLKSQGDGESGDDPDPPGGGGNNPSNLPITVVGNLPYKYASCSWDSNDITREMKSDLWAVFWREPGTYVVRAYWGNGKTDEATVTLTTTAKNVFLNYPTLTIMSNYYEVDVSNTVGSYGSGSYRLGV